MDRSNVPYQHQAVMGVFQVQGALGVFILWS